jgi:hypothetical protein
MVRDLKNEIEIYPKIFQEELEHLKENEYDKIMHVLEMDKEKYDLIWNILKNMKKYNIILRINDGSINLSNIKILYYKSTFKLKEINQKWIEIVENLE